MIAERHIPWENIVLFGIGVLIFMACDLYLTRRRRRKNLRKKTRRRGFGTMKSSAQRMRERDRPVRKKSFKDGVGDGAPTGHWKRHR